MSTFASGRLLGDLGGVGVGLLDDEVSLVPCDRALDLRPLVSGDHCESAVVCSKLRVLVARDREPLDAFRRPALAHDFERGVGSQVFMELVDALVDLAEERLVHAEPLAAIAHLRGFSSSAMRPASPTFSMIA